MVDTSRPKLGSRNRLRWTARIWLSASAVSGLVVHYYFHDPLRVGFLGLDPDIGQALWYGGFLLAIAGFAWVWSAAGGIIAIIYAVLKLFDSHSWVFFPLRPAEVALPTYYFAIYGSVYGIFLIGGILHLVAGLRQKRAVTGISYPESVIDKQIQWAARIATLAPLAIFVFIFTVIYHHWWAFFSIPFWVIAGIAWVWPAPGGVLILLLTVPGFYNLFESNYDFQLKLPAYILCLIFIASGFLHLIIAWRRREKTRGETKTPPG